MCDLTSNASICYLFEKYAAGFRHSQLHTYVLVLTLNETLLLLYCNKAFYKQTNEHKHKHKHILRLCWASTFWTAETNFVKYKLILLDGYCMHMWHSLIVVVAAAAFIVIVVTNIATAVAAKQSTTPFHWFERGQRDALCKQEWTISEWLRKSHHHSFILASNLRNRKFIIIVICVTTVINEHTHTLLIRVVHFPLVFGWSVFNTS